MATPPLSQPARFPHLVRASPPNLPAGWKLASQDDQQKKQERPELGQQELLHQHQAVVQSSTDPFPLHASVSALTFWMDEVDLSNIKQVGAKNATLVSAEATDLAATNACRLIPDT
jgi:hypothetical protein